MSHRFRLVVALAIVPLLSGCGMLDIFGSSEPSQPAAPTQPPIPQQVDAPNAPSQGGVLGTGISLFGSSAHNDQDTAPNAIGVNSFLWRASLDTVSFMPVASADPFGGVIITDWYSPPESPNERFKVNIFILDRALRSDGLRASVFRQILTADGHWADAPTDAKEAASFENEILTRARQLKIASAPLQ